MNDIALITINCGFIVISFIMSYTQVKFVRGYAWVSGLSTGITLAILLDMLIETIGG